MTRSRPTRRLTGRPRKLLRAAHVVASGSWVGLVVAMLVLGATALTSSNPAVARTTYQVMDRIGGAVIPPIAVATMLTGLILSLVTPWGLLRYWWVVTKTVLGLLVIVTGVTLTGAWIDQAQTQSLAAGPLATPLLATSTAHLAMLCFATVVSVDKPWGRIPRG